MTTLGITKPKYRAVASSSLLPITDLLVEIIPAKKIFDSIVICLWDSLKELDDLTSATAYVMDLLSNLIKKPVIEEILQKEATLFLEKLVPQLFPFFRHAIKSVRLSVLRTLLTLTHLSTMSNTDASWISIDLIRLLFQNFVLEDNKEVIQLLSELWFRLSNLLSGSKASPELLQELSKSTLSIIFAMVMSPIGTPLEARLFISYTSTNSNLKGGLNIPPFDRAMMKQDLTILDQAQVYSGRLAGAKAIGQLLSTLIIKQEFKLYEWVSAYIQSGIAFHRIIIGVVVQTWIETLDSNSIEFITLSPESQKVWDDLSQTLNPSEGILIFNEIQEELKPLYNYWVSIQKVLRTNGHVTPDISPEQFTIESATFLLDTICKPLVENSSQSLIDLHTHALNQKTNLENLSRVLDTRVYSSTASALVQTKKLPPKMNPIIINLMNSCQTEELEELQSRSANSVALLIQLQQKPKVNDKIVKNTCFYLCSDPTLVGVAKDETREGILTMHQIMSIKSIKKSRKKIDIDQAASDAVAKASLTVFNEHELFQKKLLHRGAEEILKYLSQLFGPLIFKTLGSLFEVVSFSLLKLDHFNIDDLNGDHELTQPLVDSLHVIEILQKYLSKESLGEIFTLFPMIVKCLSSKLALVRNLASRALASIGDLY
jgi:TATA-binding protein-associated factor